MDEKMKYAAIGIAVVIIVIAAVYFSGILTPKGVPDLSLTATLSPSDPVAGEASEFRITVSNLGSAAADNALLVLSIDGASAAQKTVSVGANSTSTVFIKWLAATPGSHSVRITIDSGNMIAESNESNNDYLTTVPVAERQAADVFSEIPHDGIAKAYYFNATQGGLNQFLAILASGGGSDAQFYQASFNKLKAGQLGILHYSNGSQAVSFILQSDLTPDEFIAAAGTLAGTGMASDRRVVGGKSVVYIENPDGLTSYCVFREGGWGKVVMYKRYFAPVVVMGNPYGENTTCLDIIARDYDPANATKFLTPIGYLASRVPQAGNMLLDALVFATPDKLYARGFADNNSAFISLVADAGVLIPGQCPGQLMNESNMSICHMQQASLPSSTGQVMLEAYARKQGQFTMVVYIMPLQGTNLVAARQSAISMVKGITFPGVAEYVWGTVPTMNALCAFPDTFLCSPPQYDNSTNHYLFNVTLIGGSPVTITGWKCAQETNVTEPFTLSEPITMQPSQVMEVSRPCYIAGNVTQDGQVLYLRSNIYVNLTEQATNQTRMLNGTLYINNMGGGIPGVGGGS